MLLLLFKEIKSYAVRVSLNGKMFVSNFVKMCPLVQKGRHNHRQDRDLISLVLFH